MPTIQTLPVATIGGLDLVSPPQLLAQKAGSALTLNNFEALVEGGYRRINGYVKYGDIPSPLDEEPLRGFTYYQGVLVALGEYILHSPDGIAWHTINVEGATAVPSADLVGNTMMPRLGEGTTQFVTGIFEGVEVVIVSNSNSLPAMIRIEGDTYTYTEATDEALRDLSYSTKYQDHIVIGGGALNPGTLAVSARFDPLDYSGIGSWSTQVQDIITGLHVFRDNLYIFCRSSIYRVSNLESAANVAVRPVTTKIGCVDGRTIQEIGGDVIFLADDGLRYLGATERIDDVSLTVVSDAVRPLLNDIAPLLGPINSVVISDKSQYRLFFTRRSGQNVGLIGTLSAEGKFQWTTTDDLLVSGISSTIDNREYTYHIGYPTSGGLSVYQHETGDTFDGDPITGIWETPYYHMGDSNVRKVLHSLNLYLEAEGTATLRLAVTYDHEDPNVAQPLPFTLAPLLQASRWGEAVWGTFTYGAIRYPLSNITLEGSGKWIKFEIRDTENNAPYVIRGYDLQFTPAGRI
jgi:hypothetical protein